MSFQCLKKCGECCGVVPIQEEVILRNIDKIQVKPTQTFTIEEEKQYDGSIQRNVKYPMTEDLLCIFLNRETKQCMIYDDRPDVCKDYGVKEELPCPYLKCNGNRRSPAKTRRMQRQINHDVDFKLKEIKKYGKIEDVRRG